MTRVKQRVRGASGRIQDRRDCDMTWRYQPVWIETPGEDGPERTFSLCECYFDGDGALESWTEEPAMVPQGDTVDELRGALSRMWADAWKWEPVAFETLRSGMTFAKTGVDAEDVIGAIDKAIELEKSG